MKEYLTLGDTYEQLTDRFEILKENNKRINEENDRCEKCLQEKIDEIRDYQVDRHEKLIQIKKLKDENIDLKEKLKTIKEILKNEPLTIKQWTQIDTILEKY